MTAAFRCEFCGHVHSELDELLDHPLLCIDCYEVGVAHADPKLLANEEKAKTNRRLGLSG